METFDYSNLGRRPSVRRIMADWSKAEKPAHFAAIYGETYAEFERPFGLPGQWVASGNGCEGIKRDAVERALCAEGDA